MKHHGLFATAAVIGLFPAASSVAEMRVGDTVSFVTCPIAQDRGPETDLCFFVEHRGERWSLQTQAFDSTGPMLRHKILVEGRIVAGPRECGGLRLEGMTSALPEISLECNEIRPFEVTFAASEDASQREAEALARVRTEPGLSVRPVFSGVPEYEGPAPRDWQMLYTFDSDRGDGPSLQALVALVQAAVRDQIGSIVVHGYRGASRLDNGEIMEEQHGLARQRAQKIAGIIAGLGYPKANIDVRWSEEVARPDGRTDWRRRQVTVHTINVSDPESLRQLPRALR
jgi:hypothetical protein